MRKKVNVIDDKRSQNSKKSTHSESQYNNSNSMEKKAI